jgi:16S rRNA (guanine527-N7)-methyltransferase
MELGSKDWKELIGNGAAQLGIPLKPEAIDQFAIYALELAVWNSSTNLTSITAPADIAIKHFLDSIAPLPFLPARGSLLDVGTGGGFPGLPLKIIAPELMVTLVDASRKKVSFLKHVIRRLNLARIEALQARIEKLPDQNGFIRRYDMIVCRAYSGLKEFVTQARPLLAPGGILLAFKGREAERELEVLGLAEFNTQIVRYRLPFLNAQRALILLKLRAPT